MPEKSMNELNEGNATTSAKATLVYCSFNGSHVSVSSNREIESRPKYSKGEPKISINILLDHAIIKAINDPESGDVYFEDDKKIVHFKKDLLTATTKEESLSILRKIFQYTEDVKQYFEKDTYYLSDLISMQSDLAKLYEKHFASQTEICDKLLNTIQLYSAETYKKVCIIACTFDNLYLSCEMIDDLGDEYNSYLPDDYDELDEDEGEEVLEIAKQESMSDEIIEMQRICDDITSYKIDINEELSAQI